MAWKGVLYVWCCVKLGGCDVVCEGVCDGVDGGVRGGEGIGKVEWWLII